MPRVFGHGGLRLLLLSLLEDGPQYGYELIVALEERFMGMYRPSSGTVYPRLAALEEEGLITSEEADGKRVYRLTDMGRAELARRRAEVEETVITATSTVRAVMDDLQNEVRSAVDAVRRQASSAETRQTVEEVRRATHDARREAWRKSEGARRLAVDEAKRVRRAADDLRRQAAFEAKLAGRQAMDAARLAAREAAEEAARIRRDAAAAGASAREAATAAAGSASELRPELDALITDLAAWAAEAAEQVRMHLPDDAQRQRLGTALSEARRVFLETLGGYGAE